LAALVAASQTSTTKLFRVGTVVSVTAIGITGDVAPFRNRDHFAAFNGPPPIELSSGNRKVYRFSRPGNRDLDHAVHTAAVTQISHRHSEGRASYDGKITEG
jgi:transposase